MLVSDCCNNYICRLCIGWQAKRAKRDPSYKIVCAHCYEDDFRLVDVDEEDEHFELKYYTDTPIKCLQALAAADQDKHCSSLEDSGKVSETDRAAVDHCVVAQEKVELQILTPREFNKGVIVGDKEDVVINTPRNNASLLNVEVQLDEFGSLRKQPQITDEKEEEPVKMNKSDLKEPMTAGKSLK